MLMEWLPLPIRWLHILGAAIMVGGLIYLYVCVLPAQGQPDAPPAGGPFAERVRRRWAMLVGIASLLLLVSGFVNAATYPLTYKLPAWYHASVLVKFVGGLAVMFLASILAGRSESARRWQARGRTWLGLAVALAVGLVLLAGAMNFARVNAPKKPGRDAVPIDALAGADGDAGSGRPAAGDTPPGDVTPAEATPPEVLPPAGPSASAATP